MGCCFSNDEDTGYQDQDPSEVTRLLHDPVSDGPSTRQIASYNTPAPTTQQKGDEQSALNRILHQTANNVIDVSAIETQALEQQEYMDRARQYSSRLAHACNNMHSINTGPQLPSGVAAPHVILAAQPVTLADIQLMTNAAEAAARAVHEVKVRHKEELVVPFGVP